jgi:hypothetical protein
MRCDTKATGIECSLLGRAKVSTDPVFYCEKNS